MEPIAARYERAGMRRYFRADAAFATPEVYEYLEERGSLYAIRLPANEVLYKEVDFLLTRPVVRHARRIIFQLAEVAVSREVFASLLERLNRLRPVPV